MNQAQILLRSVQLNQLIGHIQEESELAASSEDLDVEEDDGPSTSLNATYHICFGSHPLLESPQ